MIDIHCHILPNIDDGPKKIESCLEILKNAEAAGVTDAILTPHYITGTRYTFDSATKKQLLQILELGKAREGININLYLGNEIFIDHHILELLDDNKLDTLANSRYILIELPVDMEDSSAKNIIFDLQSRGLVPVIAHPERYTYFVKYPEKAQEYINRGCLFQGDYQSLFGKYGTPAKKTLTHLLREHNIHFLASDTHKPSDQYNLKNAYNKVERITKSPLYVQDLFENNPQKILSNQPLS